jgi:uncharacterized protein
MAEIRGRFLWYENLTRDVQAALGFYTAVVGWRTQQWDAPGAPYYMFANGDATLAGLHPMPPEAEHPPHWLAYIGTPDVKATTELAEHLGARIWVRLMEIPTVGTFSVIQDPQGATFAAYTPAGSPAEPAQEAGVGEFCWHELAAADVDTAFAFYQQLFGWEKKAAHDMGHMGIYQEYGLPHLALGGLYRKPAEMPGPPSWLYYVRIADLDAAAVRVRANGGSVLVEPVVVAGGGRIAVCADPQGAAFGLFQKA